MRPTKEEMQRRSAAMAEENQKHAEEAFRNFLDAPMTKFVLSYIPEGRDADAVKTVLRSAFDTGFSTGSSLVMIDVLKMIMSKE